LKNIIYKPNSLDKLVDVINNYRNIFIVTGKNSFSLCGAKEKISNLLKNKNITFFSDFQTNPQFNDVLKGIKKLRYSQCEIIIAIGGGSVIDMAKLINYYKEFQNKKFDCKYQENNFLPFIAIPTTAGSGSEATHFAVIYNNKIKYSIANQKLIPDFVILDSLLINNISKEQFAASTLDALCHSIESFWSISATRKSKKYARFAIRIALNAIQQNNNENMLLAAHLAGKSINITKTTGAHATAYYLTSHFNIQHGIAVALMMPIFIQYNSPKYELLEIFSCKNSEDLTLKFKEIMATLGISDKMSHYSIKKGDLNNIIENINSERMKNNPTIFDKTQLLDLLSYNYN
jgi:alcohol dehydrogenase